MNVFGNWDEVPIFDSDSAEADFWAANRPDLRLMEGAVAGSGESAESVTISLRIDPRMLARIKRLARSRYLNYQSMIKQWLSERMEQEVGNANPGHSLNHQPAPRQNRSGAFTLIELLVVIAIIGILAALILGLSGVAASSMRRSKAQAELKGLEAAIQSYKNKIGQYPPDNPNDPTGITNQLFYELTGTFWDGANFNSRINRDKFTPAQIETILGTSKTTIAGFANSTVLSNEVQNFFGGAAQAARTALFPIPGTPATTYTMFGIAVAGPVTLGSQDGKAINPWHYVSTNPTNNPTSYDLWIDVLYSGHTNRISNWSDTPELVH